MAKVHWLTLAAETDADSAIGTVHDILGGEMVGTGRGQYMQPLMVQHESGLRVYHGSPDPAQPVVVVADGEVCDRLGDNTVTSLTSSLRARITRLDVAEDVDPPDHARARLVAMRDDYRAGRVATKKKLTSWRWVESGTAGDGCTLYLGGRQSEIMLRCYDRRGPLRIECEIKPASRMRGLSLTSKLQAHGASAIWRGAASSIQFGFDWYQSRLAGEAVTMTPDAEIAPNLDQMLASIRGSVGMSIYFLRLAGYPLSELEIEPESMTGHTKAKYLTIADELHSIGLDGRAVREKVRQCLRSS